jgi:uncharacterized protein YndB with AHSA1/START domain
MGERRVLRLERAIPAPRPVVYRALTEPEELGKWWGPRDFTTPSVDFEPELARGYRIAMQPPEGSVFHVFGEFAEVEPPSRLVYTFQWDPPHPDDRETLVTLSLEERGEETELQLAQGAFATDERYALHESGWKESFERLEALLRPQIVLPAARPHDTAAGCR